MWTLASDTSTATGSVALFKEAALIAEIKWDKEHSHSERITLEAEKLLAGAGISFAQIDRYAVGCGPGSFTGIRVAINFIRSLAFSFDRPVYATDSLRLMAAPALAKGLDVFCMQSAFRNFVYCARYRAAGGETEETLPPSTLTVDEIVTALTRPMLVLGKGFDLFSEQLPQDTRANALRDGIFPDVPLASHFVHLLPAVCPEQLLRWNDTKPLYIRASEAEEKLKQSVRK